MKFRLFMMKKPLNKPAIIIFYRGKLLSKELAQWIKPIPSKLS